jgi:hypothetical protein
MLENEQVPGENPSGSASSSCELNGLLGNNKKKL